MASVARVRVSLAMCMSVVLVLAATPAGVVGQEAPEAPAANLSVAIDIPGSPRVVRAGEPQLVTVRVHGVHPITEVRLWVGDMLLADLPVSGYDIALDVGWRWVPDAAGDVVLLARGRDDSGSVAQSNAIHLRVAERPGRKRRPATAPGTDDQPGEGAEGPADDGPRPGVEVVGCRIRIRPVALTAGHRSAIHHLAPHATTFTRVATISAEDGVQLVELPAGPGLHLVTQSDVDARREAFGPPISVAVPAACGRAGWSGEMRLVNGRLRVPTSVDRGYLYLQVDGGPAVRVPEDPRTFVAASDGALDFGALLPRLTGEEITAEAWGWAGNRLLDLGRGRLRMSRARTASAPDPVEAQEAGYLRPVELDISDVVGFTSATDLDIVVVRGGGDFEAVLARDGALPYPTTPAGLPIMRTLRWATDMTGVTSLMWQVLPYPPGKGADVTPPFAIDLWSAAVQPGATTGDATLDFSLYLEHPVNVAQAAAGLGEMQPVILGDPWLPGAPMPSAKSGAVSQALNPVEKLALGTTPVTALPHGPTGFVGDFYVRVIPMAGATPLAPSNFVRLWTAQPDTPVTFDVVPCDTCGSNPGTLQLSWSFTLPVPGNPKYTACAVVTGFSDDYEPPPVTWPYKYKVGAVFCPSPPSDDGWSLIDAFDAAFEFVTEVWDYVSSSYDWVKAQVVAAVLTAVPCQAIADDSVCESIAHVALDAVAVGFGVPPSIPDFSSTVDALKGDLVDFIVENAAEQFPAIALACDVASAGAAMTDDLQDCRDLAALAVDEVVEQVEEARSKAAGAATGKAWPGVLFVPDPRGRWQPPTLTFTATRTDDPVQPKVCYVSGSIHSALADWHWEELVAGKEVKASGDVKGDPYITPVVYLPRLAPGESVSRTLWFEDLATWFESKDSFEYWHYAKALAHPNRAWVLLTQGARLTFSVSSNCAPDSAVGPVTLPVGAIGG